MSDVFSTPWGESIFRNKYAFSKKETWAGLAKRVAWSVCEGKVPDSIVKKIEGLIYRREFIPAGRYLYACGRDLHQVNNCFLFRAEDSREGWAEAISSAVACLMTGGGIGYDYSAIRPWGQVIKRTGGFATGPISLANMVNENGRYVMQGGQRRSAIWAGLSWWHPDIWAKADKDRGGHAGWIGFKNHSKTLRAAKEGDLTFPLPMELTNISVVYDTAFFRAIEGGTDYTEKFTFPWGEKTELTRALAKEVWDANCERAFKTAEPGWSINYGKDRESLRNACTEVVTEDDSDKCNLGTVWLNRITSKEHMEEVCRYATIFLLCGGIYSHIPTEKIKVVGAQNNRIGVGLGGIDEWLQLRGASYEVTPELHEYLAIYRDETDRCAIEWADRLKVNPPKGRRAIAPNGTISIPAEATTGIEPLFCKAYKRRYFDAGKWKHQFVVDGTTKRLIDKGIPAEKIRDAYDLGFEQRVKFQADVQDYVDMSISSTCNMPAWGSPGNNSSTVATNSKTLLKYAKRLRGFTTYPDRARGGQPLERVDDLKYALQREGVVYEEKPHECQNGVCGM